MSDMLHTFLAGAVTFGFVVAAFFFLRFWRRTRDPLFAAFALAFCLLGLGQGLLAFSDVPVEERTWLYLFRLAAFLLIIYAILGKNRRR
jgi:membrane-associated PAP2 superfamily phosphatase